MVLDFNHTSFLPSTISRQRQDICSLAPHKCRPRSLRVNERWKMNQHYPIRWLRWRILRHGSSKNPKGIKHPLSTAVANLVKLHCAGSSSFQFHFSQSPPSSLGITSPSKPPTCQALASAWIFSQKVVPKKGINTGPFLPTAFLMLGYHSGRPTGMWRIVVERAKASYQTRFNFDLQY